MKNNSKKEIFIIKDLKISVASPKKEKKRRLLRFIFILLVVAIKVFN